MAQRLAQEVGDKEFGKWVLLEIGGYHGRNKAVTDDVHIPEYRTVPGQHSDDYGRPLVLPVPPIKLQRQFSTFVWRNYNIRNKLEAASQSSNTLFNSLLQRAFKGKL